jgi:tetratricopeptide (TPR) repeat protein
MPYSRLLNHKVVMVNNPNTFRYHPLRQPLRWLCLLLLSFWAVVGLIPALKAEAMTAPELIQQGQQLYAAGQFEQALRHWQQAEKAYGKDTVGITGSLINQAQAWEATGHQRRACQLLVQSLRPNQPTAQEFCEPSPPADPFESTIEPVELRAIGLSNLGNILQSRSLSTSLTSKFSRHPI